MISKNLITRYAELKKQVPNCILLMQVGIFMHAMDEDAEVVAKVNKIKRQMAGEVEAPIVVCGFPQSALDKFIGRLVRAGYSVAVALQDETKQRHIKEIIRVQLEKNL
jgi:DNA mismatch repair protein MutS